MRRISALALLASILPALVAGTAAPAQAQGVATYRHVPAQVFGTVAVGMPDDKTVKVQHLDLATGAWDAPTTLLRLRKGVTCGGIEGRATSATGSGVALLVACDRYYFEEDPPTRSVALVTRDGHTWARKVLRGEAYRAPAISPSATYAAWLVGASGEYVAWSASTGFAAPARTTYEYDNTGETPVVDDTGTVTVIGAEPLDKAYEKCAIGIHSRDLAGQEAHTQLAVDPGCTEGDFENVDAYTVTGGGYDRANRFTLTRTGPGAPWAVTRGKPVDAPGLVEFGYGKKRIGTHFVESSVAGLPLVAIGSPDRHRIYSQAYDDATQTWGPQTLVTDTGRRCREGFYLEPSDSGLYVDSVRCGRSETVYASADGQTWTVRDVGRRPWTLTAGGATLPGRTGTTVVTRTAVREYPGTTDGPCDVVQAGREGELVRAHGGRSWPTKVQVSTGGAFRTVSKARRFENACTRVFFDGASQPTGFVFGGTGRDHYGRLVLREGTWRLVYPRRFN